MTTDNEFYAYKALVKAAMQDIHKRMAASYYSEPGRRLTYMDMDAFYEHVGNLGMGGCLDQLEE
jgi:hypothetical protein